MYCGCNPADDVEPNYYFSILFNMVNSISPLAEISQRRELMGVLWLLLLAVVKHTDIVKCLKLYLSCLN